MQDIRTLIRKLADTKEELYSVICKVTAVNERTIDVEPINGDAPIFDVKLEADKGKTILIIPKLNSVVVVTFISKEDAFVSLFSEVESITLLGDAFGGLVNAVELKKQLDIVTKRIDTIYDAINNAVPVPQDGGAALQAGMRSTLAVQLQKEDYTEIENEKIKHG